MLLENPSFPHVVIGAGIIGLSTAFELFSRGVPATEIAVIDPAPRSGATCAAGGMLAPCAEVQYKQEPLYPLMVESARLYPDFVARLQRYTDQDLGYRTESTFVVAADRADAAHLKELTTHQQGHLFEVERLTLRQARAKEPGLHPQLAGVVEIPGDHQINPRMYSEALLQVLRSQGVTFIESAAEHLDCTDGRCTAVRCANGAVAVSDTVYVCNGLGAAQLTGWHPEGEGNPLQLRPVRGDMLRLRVPAQQEPPVSRVIRGFVEDRPIYIIPRTDGTIAVGATSREDSRRNPAVDGVFTLLRDAIRILPGLEDCEFIEAITGDRPGTPDDMPYLALRGDNVVISTGYFRHGILLSALGATVGADLGLDRSTAYEEALWTSQ